MALSGCPAIVGNSNKDSGQNSNVRLSSDLTTSDSMISIVGELTNTTPIGIAKDITEKNQGVFTTGSTDAIPISESQPESNRKTTGSNRKATGSDNSGTTEILR
jgi:hypothetical protein